MIELNKKDKKESFHELHLNRIHLKVRKTHEIGIHLYSDMGFKLVKEISELTNEIETEYYLMEILKNNDI